MLEAVILDNTERMLGAMPYLGKVSTEFLHLDSGSVATAHRYFNQPHLNGYWYNPVLECFFAATADSYTNVGLLRIVPDNYGTASAVTSTDSALAFQVLCNDPSGSGHMWGVVNSSGANDGLWVRSAVLAGTWTKVVAAAAGNNQTLVIGEDDSLWYYNVTAGNWYQLNNGAAGNVQVTQPTAIGLYGHEYNKAKGNMNQTSKFGFIADMGYDWGAGMYDKLGVFDYRRLALTCANFGVTRSSAAVSTVNASYHDGRKFMSHGALHLLNKTTSASGYGGACNVPGVSSHVATLPIEFFLSAVPHGSQHTSFIAAAFSVSPDYMLFVLRGLAMYDSSTTYPNMQGDGYLARYSLALFNTQTYGIRHLGVLGHQHNIDYSTKTSNAGGIYNAPMIRFGRIKDGALELYSVGKQLSDHNGTTAEVSYLHGLSRHVVELNNLDI